MSEGPYRDLGNGFARLTGVEGVRRAPSRVRTVEDALLELVRNAVDAGANSVYVATALRSRRYRELVVLDDGCGIPEAYRKTIFEPGVTTRHLSPSRLSGATHGAGLSLHHLKQTAVSAAVISTHSPTSIKAVFDTELLPERALQSSSRGSRSNLLATLRTFTELPQPPQIYYGSPANILRRLLDNRIILEVGSVAALESWCRERMGVELSRRTLQRLFGGAVGSAARVEPAQDRVAAEKKEDREVFGADPLLWGGRLDLGERDLFEIRSVLERAARESYLEVGKMEFSSKDGELTIQARVYESEDEYEVE